MIKHVAIAVSVLSIVAVATPSEAAKHPRKHSRVPRADGYASLPARAHDEPYMIEARPGVWISSWDCIQDEGNGRWTPCSIGNAGGRN